jgi:hypothetical protein
MINEPELPTPTLPEKQEQFYAYRADGVYEGIVIATKTQLREMGLTAGPEPAVTTTLQPVLTPRQFEWLLAYTGLDEVWAALEAHLKTTDRAAYARLRAERKATAFEHDTVLKTVAEFQPFAAAVAPGVDLSDAAINAAWEQAALYGK